MSETRLIYFHSPGGTWITVNKNLHYLGLDKDKIVKNTYLRDFILEIMNNTYNDKYKDVDVLVVDEFYSHFFNDDVDSNKFYNVVKELLKQDKIIVMAGHGKIDNLYDLPNEMKKCITEYNLRYDVDIDIELPYTVEYM